jgi:superfamily I DNA/RNA helicase
MSLPQPIGRQKEVLYLPAQGHVAVLGTAGSGKTTLAILRAAYLADPRTEHQGKTLLVTFNRALVTYLKHIQDRKLANVVIENYHTFARGYLAARGKLPNNSILSPNKRDNLIKKAVEKGKQHQGQHSLFSRPLDLFSEEFHWIAKQGIDTFEDYQNVDPLGRFGTRIERKDRELFFEIYKTYRELCEQLGYQYDWDNIATAVCREFDADNSNRLYRHVIIDEGQDFSPEMIRSLAKAIPSNGSLTFFGDVVQQIYGHRISWRSAGLKIEKVWEFKENYRNSKQIAKLALAISKMPYFKDIPDIVEPVSPIADAPSPTIVEFSSINKEIEFVILQATEAAKTQSVAILLRNRQDENLIDKHLTSSIRLDRDMTKWEAGPGIRYGTYHSAKGLEFDMVILPFCNNQNLPDSEAIAAFGEADAIAQDGRLLYVGVTRAKTRLIITYSGELTQLLPSDMNLYKRLSR